ncbi:MAG: tetratricopeptide repeat protein [Cyanobacteriota bacterium]
MKDFKIRLLLALLILFSIQTQVFALSGDFEKGKSAYYQKDYLLAMQYFRRALSTNPSNATYRYFLAQALVQTYDLDKAQKEYQRIIQTAPYSKEAKYAKIALVQIRDYVNNSLHPKWRPLNSNMEIGVSETSSRADVGDNYIDKVTEKGNVIRWQKAGFPLKVYFDARPKKVRQFLPEFVPAVKRGIDKWVKDTKGTISITYVDSPETADVKITWREILDSKLAGSDAGTAYTAGVTTPEYSGKELFAMSIILTTTDPNGKPHNPEDIEKVTTHEFGHAIGIMGHSESSGDIMFPNSQSDGQLTDRDINTITLLYELEPDISNFKTVDGTAIATAGKAKPEEPSKNKEVLGSKDERLQREIEEIETAIKENPKSDINHVNLGNLYGDQGDYEAAIKEYKKAILLNPKNEIAYSNLGAMYQNQGKPYDALRAYNESKKLNIDKPKPYLQVAIIAEELNQKAEAIMSLKKYLELNPKGVEDKEVLNLLKKLDLTIDDI